MRKFLIAMSMLALCAPLATTSGAPAPTSTPAAAPPPDKMVPRFVEQAAPQPAPPIYASMPFWGASCEQRKQQLEEIVALQAQLIDALKAENAELKSGTGPRIDGQGG